MQEAVDFLFSHIVTAIVLLFLTFAAVTGIGVLHVTNYTHEASEVISRNGGLTKPASDQLSNLTKRYRWVNKVTLYQDKNKDNKPDSDAPAYRSDRIPYGKTEYYVIWIHHLIGNNDTAMIQSVNSDVRQ